MCSDEEILKVSNSFVLGKTKSWTHISFTLEFYEVPSKNEVEMT